MEIPTDREIRQPNIVIIGAGISGITAARKLLSAGLNNVIILEAQDRFGGRILTQKFDSGIVDLGAQWIHGESNHVYQVAKKFDLLEKDSLQPKVLSTSTASEYVWHNYFTSYAEPIPRDLVEEISNVMDNLYDEANEFYHDSLKESFNDYTVGEFYKTGFEHYLRTCIGDSKRVTKLKRGLYQWRLMWENVDNGCETTNDMSLYGWGKFEECEGHGLIDVKAGFQDVCTSLAKEIPQNVIRLSKPVQTIHWKSSNLKNASLENLKITNSNGDLGKQAFVICNNGDVFPADHVIITTSLGYLKKHTRTLFQPSLPTDKLNAIDHMGFNSVAKVFLKWDQPFWSKEFTGVQFVWLHKQISITSSRTSRKTKNGAHWYQQIHGFTTVRNQSKVLLGWLAGDAAAIMEDLPESEVKNVCHELLVTFTGDVTIPAPCSIIRSQWTNNKYICGAYSYISIDTTPEDHTQLTKSLPSEENPALLFAGEAGSARHFSTTHGAMETGLLAADKLIKIYAPEADNPETLFI